MTIYNQSYVNQDSLIRAHLCENHFGMSPTVLSNLDQHRASLYPDPNCGAIRQEIANFHDVDVDMVTVANGTDEIILMTALAFLKSQVPALVSSSSFPGYVTAAQTCGASVVHFELDGYSVPINAMAKACLQQRSLGFICNPHNPTGTIASGADLESLISHAEKTDSLLVFDEAYAEFADEKFVSALSFLRRNKRVLITRTFSKAYGIAGFRIGYAIGCANDIRRIRAVQFSVPFAVNRLAQTAAIYALRDQHHLLEVVHSTNLAKAYFYQALDRARIRYVPSHTNFVLLDVSKSKSGSNSADFAERLIKDFGIIVRDTTLFGLPSHIRVSMPRECDLDTLCTAIISIHNE